MWSLDKFYVPVKRADGLSMSRERKAYWESFTEKVQSHGE